MRPIGRDIIPIEEFARPANARAWSSFPARLLIWLSCALALETKGDNVKNFSAEELILLTLLCLIRCIFSRASIKVEFLVFKRGVLFRPRCYYRDLKILHIYKINQVPLSREIPGSAMRFKDTSASDLPVRIKLAPSDA